MCCLFDEAYDERNIPVNADLKIKGGGHPDPEIGGGGRVSKINFLALQASVWSKN